MWFAICLTMEQAREERDRMLRQQEKARLKRCPVCSKAIRGKKSSRVYCSTACNLEALAQGVLVSPGKALPSTRRKAREKRREEQRAFERELLSNRTGPIGLPRETKEDT